MRKRRDTPNKQKIKFNDEGVVVSFEKGHPLKKLYRNFVMVLQCNDLQILSPHEIDNAARLHDL